MIPHAEREDDVAPIVALREAACRHGSRLTSAAVRLPSSRAFPQTPIS